jgi:hypothetical protein
VILRLLTWYSRRRLASKVLLALVAAPNVNAHPSKLVASARYYADVFYGVAK